MFETERVKCGRRCIEKLQNLKESLHIYQQHYDVAFSSAAFHFPESR